VCVMRLADAVSAELIHRAAGGAGCRGLSSKRPPELNPGGCFAEWAMGEGRVPAHVGVAGRRHDDVQWDVALFRHFGGADEFVDWEDRRRWRAWGLARTALLFLRRWPG